MSVYLEVFFRSILSFFALLVLVRLMGKQQMAELTFFDYVVGITIGSIASTLSVQVNESTLGTLLGLAIWTVLPIILTYLSLKNVWIRKVVEGEPVVVVENGKIREEQLRRVGISTDNLLSLLRTKNAFSVADVEFALFEPNGELSVQKKSQKQPIAPSDLNLPTQYDGLPTNLVLDGVLLDDALHSLSLSKAWLQHQLNKQNVQNISDVSLAQLDTKGNLYVDLKGNKPSFVITTSS